MHSKLLLANSSIRSNSSLVEKKGRKHSTLNENKNIIVLKLNQSRRRLASWLHPRHRRDALEDSRNRESMC